MQVLFNKSFLKHNKESEFEGAYRIAAYSDFPEETKYEGENYIQLVHPESYIKRIKYACNTHETLAEINLNPDSYDAALQAVGLTVLAAENGDFALVRPPGHHAAKEKASGFCLFNNLAIATQKLVNKGKRVFIFDFDGHHGDGTQSIFYDSNQVFYASLHQMNTFPYSGLSFETGSGNGEGFTLNFPLLPGSDDTVFYKVLDKIIFHARKFQPDVIAVSAGFDGFKEDKILQLKFTEKAYYECGLRLRKNFSDVFAVLEGGYHNKLKDCVDAFVSGVNVGARPIKNSFDYEMSVG